MSTRCYGNRKHDWRKIGAVYDKQHGLRATKRKCLRCGEIQNIEAERMDREDVDY